MFLVIRKFVNGNTTCFVESIQDHGSVRVFPCLQIYVKPFLNDYEISNGINNSDNTRIQEVSSSNRNSAQSSQDQSECEPECDDDEADKPKDALLLYQNEFNFAGMDYIYRRCSYLPSFCPSKMQALLLDICSYSFFIGEVNSTIDCYYDESKQWVIREKKITKAEMAHALLWPLIGILISIGCCIGFWRRNYKHISRLYIYNSWSAT